MRLNHSVPWNGEMKREIERWENEGGRVSLIPTWREPLDPDAANGGPGLQTKNSAAAERQTAERNGEIGKQPLTILALAPGSLMLSQTLTRWASSSVENFTRLSNADCAMTG